MADTAAETARELLGRAIQMSTFSGAVAEVGDGGGPLWSGAFGALTFEPGAPPCTPATIFDLASLTKLLTATVVVGLAERRVIHLGEPVAAAFDEWRGADRDSVTLQDLLEHASGLPARLIDRPPTGRVEFQHEICAMPLEYEPRQQSVYSDLGYILLGFLAEDRGQATLRAQAAALVAMLGLGGGDWLDFDVPAGAHDRVASTIPLPDDLRRGRLLTGEVHDSYAAALGGVAGHSGLFGTASAVGRLAAAVLSAARGDRVRPAPFTPLIVARMTTRSAVPGSSRGLGWDTMLPTSSCGPTMSPAAFGHVGFTGTSLWIDPVLDRYFVLLTNRAGGGGTLDEMREVRRAFHGAVTKLGF